MTSGRILNIQHFCIHDGPGIRTTVFLKGCPLSCTWCSNPNMQKAKEELGYAKNKCVGCQTCVHMCPEHCMTFVNGALHIYREKCTLCKLCISACPGSALHMDGVDVSVEYVMEEVSKDRIFYDNSSGGVTLSGGEVLAQKKFAISVLKSCKEMGIHTALETSAYAQYTVLEEVAWYVDHLFIDIKHMDSAKHTSVTGVSNDLIRENIEKIQTKHPELHIRIPVIPSINDTFEELAQIALFLERLDGVKDVELLQYHDFGATKYAQTGRAYALQDVTKYDLEHLKALVEHVRNICPSRKVLCQAS